MCGQASTHVNHHEVLAKKDEDCFGHVFFYLFNQRMAIYHLSRQRRIFYLVLPVLLLNSAFLWKTAVILIDEI